MIDSSSPIVLHNAQTTFLRWVIPLFVVMGCLLVTLNLWLPVLARSSPPDAGYWLLVGLALLASLVVPAGAALMYLLIPRIITTLDPQRRSVAMEFRRPLRPSVKEYPLRDIAGLQPVYVRNRSYALALVLKSGEHIRLDYRLMPTPERWQPQADQIQAQLAPYLLPGV